MIRKYKDYFNYYAWFGKLKHGRKNNVANFKSSSLYTSDPTFIDFVKSGASKENAFVTFTKARYNIYDRSDNNKVIGYVDKYFNVFNLKHEYSGTIHNLTRVFAYVTSTILAIIIIFLLLIILLLRTTKDAVKPTDIHITDQDGMAVEQQWNIFGQTEEEKIIMPGKKGTYYFNINNENFFDIVCKIEFDEENSYCINMDYRVREGKYKYLQGSSDEYIDIDSLNTEGIVVPARSFVTLALDWYWVDDGSGNLIDTDAGNSGLATYTVYVRITGEEKTE